MATLIWSPKRQKKPIPVSQQVAEIKITCSKYTSGNCLWKSHLLYGPRNQTSVCTMAQLAPRRTSHATYMAIGHCCSTVDKHGGGRAGGLPMSVIMTIDQRWTLSERYSS